MWSPSQCSDMKYMFHESSSLNQRIGDASQVSDMSYMYFGVGSVHQSIGG